MINRQAGIALISVLLIVVLLSSLAVSLYTHQSFATTQTRMVLETTQLRELLLSSELYATELLKADYGTEETRVRDDLNEDWATADGVVETQVGTIRFQIFDLNSKFNLNSLSQREPEVPMRALRSILDEHRQDLAIVEVWRDWVDPDDTRFVSAFYAGREDLDWLSNSPPIRTANHIASDLTELLVLAPMSQDEFHALGAHTAVLPTSELKINVNTAASQVLNALLAEEVTPLSHRSVNRNFGTIETFIEIHQSFESVKQYLEVRSEYFEVQASISGFNTRLDMTSHLKRDKETGLVRVYARRFGVTHDWVESENRV